MSTFATDAGSLFGQWSFDLESLWGVYRLSCLHSSYTCGVCLGLGCLDPLSNDYGCDTPNPLYEKIALRAENMGQLL